MLCPHSVILWLGDLNYRIEELDMEKVKKLIEEKAFQTLHAYDQVQMATCALPGSCAHTVRARESLASTVSLFFLDLGGSSEELMSSHGFLSPASPSSIAVPSVAGPWRCLVSLGSRIMFSLSLSVLCVLIYLVKLGLKGHFSQIRYLIYFILFYLFLYRVWQK